MDIWNKAAGGNGKLAKIKQHLQALQSNGQTEVGGGETIADDGGIPADKQAQIARDEGLVRQVLGLFGINYDALIKMDGQSVYSCAVKANPALAQQVGQAENPILEALKVAVQYKPVADFTGKYGTTPEAIKAAVRAEIEAEMQGKDADVKRPVAEVGPVFSGRPSGAVGKPAKGNKLSDVFGK